MKAAVVDEPSADTLEVRPEGAINGLERNSDEDRVYKVAQRRSRGLAVIEDQPPLPLDPFAPFLRPTARTVVEVPLSFSSHEHWCDVIGNNLLAEFWYSIKDSRTSRKHSSAVRFHGTDAGREYVVECCQDQNLVHNLLEQDGQLLLVKEQRYVDVGKIWTRKTTQRSLCHSWLFWHLHRTVQSGFGTEVSSSR